MKRFTTILLATMLSLAAFAQGGTKDLWHDKSTRGFELTLKGFVAPPGGKIIYDWGGSKHIYNRKNEMRQLGKTKCTFPQKKERKTKCDFF